MTSVQRREQNQTRQQKKLEDWTESPLHATRRAGDKSAFLMQFDEATLREGLIYAISTRRELLKQYETNSRIKEKQYCAYMYSHIFEDLNEGDTDMEYDGGLSMAPMDHVADYASDVRSWNGFVASDNPRRLRYTVMVTVRLNARMKDYLDKFSRAIGAAQGDIEPKQDGRGKGRGSA